MADAAILVCACGAKLKAAGAVPGRVGKCPYCGGMLRVPDAEPAPADSDRTGAPTADPDAPGWTSTYTQNKRSPPAARRIPSSPGVLSGLIRPPARHETRLLQSLLYPAWSDPSLALLLFMPPVLAFASMPPVTLLLGWLSGNPTSTAFGLVALLPGALMFLPVGSYTLLYLGRVLVASATGDVSPPRWPEWDLSETIRGLLRWCWALVIGGIAGGFPSVAYWMYCGDVDVLDAIILVQFAAGGALYAQVALLASILHDDPLAANPVTVFQALWRVGQGWVLPALVIASYAYLAVVGLIGVVAIGDPLLAALAFWLYWVLLLYGAMVVLRVLGLTYHRHAWVLGWFRDRPRWGA